MGTCYGNLNQPWLQPRCLEEFANAIHQKGAAMDNCWGFVDGTVRPISRPGQNQRVLYYGHKRVHVIKFQSVVSPNGLICFPLKGLDTMQECCECPVSWRHSSNTHTLQQIRLCIYGDFAYPMRVHLQVPH